MLIKLSLFIFIACFTSGSVIAQSGDHVVLPKPALTGSTSLEQVLAERRSVRTYTDTPLMLAEVGQLLWAAQGITHTARGFRTAPSAGALYPLELYVAIGHVEDLEQGIYHYDPVHHQLEKTSDDDVRAKLSKQALSQPWVKDAAAVIVITADYERTTTKYGDRGYRYVFMEVGHAAQNLLLQVESLGLGSVVVGAFHYDKVAKLLKLPTELQALILMPVGRK
jgi:SagB-type dehydrogenase family enzyme